MYCQTFRIRGVSVSTLGSGRCRSYIDRLAGFRVTKGTDTYSKK